MIAIEMTVIICVTAVVITGIICNTKRNNIAADFFQTLIEDAIEMKEAEDEV